MASALFQHFEGTLGGDETDQLLPDVCLPFIPEAALTSLLRKYLGACSAATALPISVSPFTFSVS